jgi:hypothetical protein
MSAKKGRSLALLPILVLCLIFSVFSGSADAVQQRGATLPDDKSGYQIQLVYVETASSLGSSFNTSGEIESWVDQLQAWLRNQTGKELIFDTFKGEYDIAYLKFEGNIQKARKDDEKLVQMYRKSNPTTYYGKTLAFIVDQTSPVGSTNCGWAGNFTDYALIFPNLTYPGGGQCKGFESITKINSGFSFEAQSLLHEILHTYGVKHVCVNSTDLMQGSPECEKAGVEPDSTKPITFDISASQYFGGSKSGVDIKSLKIWSDGSGLKRPNLNQGICWAGENCTFQMNTFPEQGVVQLQIKVANKWQVVNSVKGQLSNCRDCYKYSYVNRHTFIKPGIYEFRIVKTATKKYSAYTGRPEKVRVL